MLGGESGVWREEAGAWGKLAHFGLPDGGVGVSYALGGGRGQQFIVIVTIGFEPPVSLGYIAVVLSMALRTY
jgi:hypothetical protein